MAEALATVSIVARKSFRHVKTEISLLESTLQQIKEAIGADSVADGTRKALLPVIAGCQEQIAPLDAMLAKTLLGSITMQQEIKRSMLASLSSHM
jgi:hypothetical protein